MGKLQNVFQATGERMLIAGDGVMEMLIDWAIVGLIVYGLQYAGLYGPVAFGAGFAVVFGFHFGMRKLILGLPPAGKR